MDNTVLLFLTFLTFTYTTIIQSKVISLDEQANSLIDDKIIALLDGPHSENTIDHDDNVREESNLAELEIRGFPETQERNAIGRDDFRRWRMIDQIDGRVVVPYTFAGNFTENELAIIRRGMDVIENNTCVKYLSLGQLNDTFDGYFLEIGNTKKGCNCYVGRDEGKKSRMNLESGQCVYDRCVVHELLHGLGLWHEQNRPDSEKYIVVHYENMKPEFHQWFRPMSKLVTYGFPYDYASVMHYGQSDFATNRSDITIETKDPSFQKIIGKASHPSDIDYQKVCSLYMCSECIGKPFAFPTESSGHLASNSTN